MNRSVVVETHLDGAWRRAARIELEESPLRHRAGARLVYETAYATAHLLRARAAVSCSYPVDFRPHTTVSEAVPRLDEHDQRRRGWPAFLLDLVPQGFARRTLTEHPRVPERDLSEVDLLLAGARNPIGNLRVVEPGAPAPERVPRRGFTLEEIDASDEAFIELARSAGVLLPGSSGVQGDAPKMLLVRGDDGLYYADGSLADAESRAWVLVKMRRGKTERDLQILRNERAYMEVARAVGLRANEPLVFHQRTLFVPRFDRRAGGERLGQESLASLAGINEHGVAVPQLTLCRALARHSTSPTEDVAEFVLRDLLNYALGNTDNHARNTAVQRLPDGSVRLSPLFDFAPMFRDPEGIARRFRWKCEEGGALIVPEVLRELGALKRIDQRGLARIVAAARPAFDALASLMERAGVDADIIRARDPYATIVAATMGYAR